MPDDSQPPADKAVLAFFEIIAFALGWGGVDRLLDGKSLLSVLPIFAATILTSYTGFKWPQIKRKTAPWLFAPKSRSVWTALFLVCSLWIFEILAGPEFIVRLHRWHGWVGYVIVASLGAILACGYWWLAGVMSKPADKTMASTPSPSIADEKPPTLLDLFKTDFPNTLRASDSDVDAYTIKAPEGSSIKVKRQTYEDEARTKFVGFYVSGPDPPAKDFSGRDTFAACMELLDHHAVQDTFDHFGKQVAVVSGYGNQMTTSKELTFSGRVLIYHEEFLPIQSQAEIIRAYQAKELAVVFKGPDYLGTKVIAWHQQHDAKKVAQ